MANLGLQVFGGHGYVADNGIEQVVRDGRISTVYEGTTGIQALDLIGRKVLGNGGTLLRQVTAVIRSFCVDAGASGGEEVQAYCQELARLCDEWESLAGTISERAIKNLDELGASSVDFLMYSGYVVLGYLWGRMALAAENGAGAEAAFNQKKLATARFYFARLLPRAGAHAAAALAGAETVMSIEHDDFAI